LPEFDEIRKWLSEFEGVKYDTSIKNAVRILPSGRFEGFFMARIVKV
jgi:hypothetical protein